jgi:hypothetical protein
MARISTYTIDTLDTSDKFLGTDQAGATRNFQAGPVINAQGGAKAGTIVNYIAECDPRALAFVFHNATFGGNGSMQNGTINVTGSATTKAFSAVTTLKVSKFPYAASLQASPNTAVNILSEYVGERIKWSDINNPNIYGIYECTSFVQDGSTDFYDMTLVHRTSNGSFMAGDNSSTTPDVYLLELFGTDKNYEHVQDNATNPWSINHNLNKFPSVTIKLGDGKEVQAAVTHTDKNNLVITFSGSNSGKAYMN